MALQVGAKFKLVHPDSKHAPAPEVERTVFFVVLDEQKYHFDVRFDNGQTSEIYKTSPAISNAIQI